MSIDAMTALGMKSNQQLEKKLKVWECDEYTWILAGNRKDANKAYLSYLHDIHGQNLAGIEVGLDGDFKELSLDSMRDAIFYPNDQNDSSRTFLIEYDHQITTDPVTPRLFAVGE